MLRVGLLRGPLRFAPVVALMAACTALPPEREPAERDAAMRGNSERAGDSQGDGAASRQGMLPASASQGSAPSHGARDADMPRAGGPARAMDVARSGMEAGGASAADGGMSSGSAGANNLDAGKGGVGTARADAAANDAAAPTGLALLGRSCASAAACMSGRCIDEVCCEAAACGTCASCNGESSGRCSPVRDADDGDTCQGPRSCTSQAVCAQIDRQSSQELSEFVTFNTARIGAAQTWTVGRSGQLIEVRLALTCGGSVVSGLGARLESVGAAGAPTGTVLAQLVPGEFAQGVARLTGLPVQPPLDVQLGQRLAIVIESNYCTIGHTLESVPGGTRFSKIATDAGPASWAADQGALNFLTLMAEVDATP